MKTENSYTTVNPAYSEGRKMFKIALVFLVIVVVLANI